jgi:hypothetical protein
MIRPESAGVEPNTPKLDLPALRHMAEEALGSKELVGACIEQTNLLRRIYGERARLGRSRYRG